MTDNEFTPGKVAMAALICCFLWKHDSAQDPIPFAQLPEEPIGQAPDLFRDWYRETYPEDQWQHVWCGLYEDPITGLEVTHEGAVRRGWDAHAALGGSPGLAANPWLEEDLKTAEGLMATVDRLQEISDNGAVTYLAVYDFLVEQIPNHMPALDRDWLAKQYGSRPGITGFVRDRRAWESRPLHKLPEREDDA